MLAIGDPIPDVDVLATDLTRVNLRRLAIDGAYLLAFYPFDWTDT
jgi:peroxiredoxin